MDKNCNAYDNDDTVDIENRVGTDYKLLQQNDKINDIILVIIIITIDVAAVVTMAIILQY